MNPMWFHICTSKGTLYLRITVRLNIKEHFPAPCLSAHACEQLEIRRMGCSKWAVLSRPRKERTEKTAQQYNCRAPEQSEAILPTGNQASKQTHVLRAQKARDEGRQLPLAWPTQRNERPDSYKLSSPSIGTQISKYLNVKQTKRTNMQLSKHRIGICFSFLILTVQLLTKQTNKKTEEREEEE